MKQIDKLVGQEGIVHLAQVVLPKVTIFGLRAFGKEVSSYRVRSVSLQQFVWAGYIAKRFRHFSSVFEPMTVANH